MFAIKFSIEKGIKNFWIAGFFLPAINATVFSVSFYKYCSNHVKGQNTFQPKPKKNIFLFFRISELVVVNIMPWISQWETVLMMNATKTPLYPSYPRLWSVTNPQPLFYNVALILYLGIGWVALMSLLKVSLDYFSKNLV